MADAYMDMLNTISEKQDEILSGQVDLEKRFSSFEKKVNELAGNALELMDSSGGVMAALSTVAGLVGAGRKNGEKK